MVIAMIMVLMMPMMAMMMVVVMSMIVIMVIMMAVMVTVFMVLMVLMVAVTGLHRIIFLLRAVKTQLHARARNAAGSAFFRIDSQPRNAGAVHSVQKSAAIRQQLIKRCHQHIAGSAHAAVQINQFHSSAPCSSAGLSIRLMRFARNPAPKPLSMLTTQLPEAQELSIAKSAATPPKLAP